MERAGFLRAAILGAGILGLAGCIVPTARRPLVTKFDPPAQERDPPAPGPLTARFLGTSTIVVSDGRTTIVTDGFFSRPSVGRLLWRPVTPRKGRILDALKAGNVEHASAIFVAHSHHDHAMDTPYVAQLTGATIVGSRSTENIALGVGFPRDRIERIEHGSICRFGAFTVTILQTPHSGPTLFPGDIDSKLGRSAWVEEYREGGNFTFHVAHPSGNVLIVPSRGAWKDWDMPLKAKTVFLGVGGPVWRVGQLRPSWDQFVAGSEATAVYPIHWDNFFKKPDPTIQPGIPRGLKRKLPLLERLAGRSGMVMVPYYAEVIRLEDDRKDVNVSPASAALADPEPPCRPGSGSAR